jgi:hypothetical protein
LPRQACPFDFPARFPDTQINNARRWAGSREFAILAMIPLTRSVFWGRIAAAIMGGLFNATVLTLLFLPALHAAWFRVKPAPVAVA